MQRTSSPSLLRQKAYIHAVSDGKLFQSLVIATDSDQLLFSLVPMIGDALWTFGTVNKGYAWQ